VEIDLGFVEPPQLGQCAGKSTARKRSCGSRLATYLVGQLDSQPGIALGILELAQQALRVRNGAQGVDMFAGEPVSVGGLDRSEKMAFGLLCLRDAQQGAADPDVGIGDFGRVRRLSSQGQVQSLSMHLHCRFVLPSSSV
jgi:hypothetical protein